LEQEFGLETTTLLSAWAKKFKREESGQIVIMHIQRTQLLVDTSNPVLEEKLTK
jgi:hypothetical protein